MPGQGPGMVVVFFDMGPWLGVHRGLGEVVMHRDRS